MSQIIPAMECINRVWMSVIISRECYIINTFVLETLIIQWQKEDPRNIKNSEWLCHETQEGSVMKLI